MIRRILPVSVVGLSMMATACTDDCTTHEPAYAGAASDEAWRVLLDARETASTDGDIPVFTAPATESAIAADAPPTFAWSSPLKVASGPALDPRLLLPRRRATSWFDKVRAVVMPSAHAHLPPITSDVYMLEVDVPGRTCPVTGVTTELDFTFSSGDWEAVVAGSAGERTARLLSAFLTENRVTEGAFVATPLTFTVDE